MTGPNRRLLAAALLALAPAACDPVGPPTRPDPYPFRLKPDDPLFHWPAASMPIRFFPESGPPLGDYLRGAFRAWGGAFLYGEFRAVGVSDAAQADVLVRFSGAAPPDAPLTNDPPNATVCGGVTTVPTAADVNGQLTYTAPFIVTLEWFDTGAPPSDVVNCLARVTTHEVGHVLGLFAHSPTPTDLMHFEVTEREPSARDAATVQELYHLPTEIQPWSPEAGPNAVGGAGVGIP